MILFPLWRIGWDGGDGMTIHVVTAGQTLYAIGELYGVAPGLIARYNNLSAPYELAVGQSLVILKPKELYTVQEGDSRCV